MWDWVGSCNLGTEAGERAKGTGVQIWCQPGVIMGALRGRDRPVGAGQREERTGEGGGKKIPRRRGRGLCSRESCWEQIRRHGSSRD